MAAEYRLCCLSHATRSLPVNWPEQGIQIDHSKARYLQDANLIRVLLPWLITINGLLVKISAFYQFWPLNHRLLVRFDQYNRNLQFRDVERLNHHFVSTLSAVGANSLNVLSSQVGLKSWAGLWRHFVSSANVGVRHISPQRVFNLTKKTDLWKSRLSHLWWIRWNYRLPWLFIHTTVISTAHYK